MNASRLAGQVTLRFTPHQLQPRRQPTLQPRVAAAAPNSAQQGDARPSTAGDSERARAGGAIAVDTSDWKQGAPSGSELAAQIEAESPESEESQSAEAIVEEANSEDGGGEADVRAPERQH